jgi:hypothetical protein
MSQALALSNIVERSEPARDDRYDYAMSRTNRQIDCFVECKSIRDIKLHLPVILFAYL